MFVGMGVGYAFLIRAFRLWAIPMALIYFPLMWWILLSAGHITGLPWLRVIVREPSAAAGNPILKIRARNHGLFLFHCGRPGLLAKYDEPIP